MITSFCLGQSYSDTAISSSFVKVTLEPCLCLNPSFIGGLSKRILPWSFTRVLPESEYDMSIVHSDHGRQLSTWGCSWHDIGKDEIIALMHYIQVHPMNVQNVEVKGLCPNQVYRVGVWWYPITALWHTMKALDTYLNPWSLIIIYPAKTLAGVNDKRTWFDTRVYFTFCNIFDL